MSDNGKGTIEQLIPLLTDVAADNKKRVEAKPIPILRSALVLSYDSDTGDAEVLIDGDDEPTAIQVTGPTPAVNDRVTVQFQPPRGIVLAGYVGGGASSGGSGSGSGAKGDKGDKGDQGEAGLPGRLITTNRLVISGHSYAWDDLNTPYGGTNPQNGDETRDSANFAVLLRDAVVGNALSSRFVSVPVPACAAGTNQTTTLGVIPEDTVVEGVWYVPNAALTGANTNTRRHEIQTQGLLGATTFGQRQYDSGTDLTASVPQAIYQTMGGAVSNSTRAKGPTGTLSPFTPWQPSISYVLGATAGRANVLTWKSSAIGTGLADPGGTVLVRLGGRYRNLAQGGALLLMGGAYMGGWGASFANHRAPQAFGVEVNTTASASTSATSLTVEGLAAPIPSGWKIEFTNGVTATTNGAATVFATAVTVLALSGAVPAGQQGFAKPTTDSSDAYLSEATHVGIYGINDSAWWIPQDRPAWRETVRSLMALWACPYLAPASRRNITYSGAGWEDFTQPAGGQWVTNTPYALAGSNKRYTGAAGGTATIKVAPDFPGGAVDIFAMALSGPSHGARATISVDGGTAKTLDTTGASLTANYDAITGTTLTGVTFLVGTGYNASQVGRVIDHPGVPKGTICGFVNDAGTAMTLTDPVTGAAVGASSDQTSVAGHVIGYCPMVKRLTGLTAGAHTIVLTVTAIDATDKSAALIFYGYGLETPTSILWCNIPHLPNGFANANITAQNLDTAAVIAGTAAPVGTSTQEPSVDSLVQLIDIDTIMGSDPANFLSDDLHPNALGHRRIADELIGKMAGISGGSGTGVLDHGLLTGLADDDHPQYITQAELDAALGAGSGGLVRVHEEIIGDGAASLFGITHGLGRMYPSDVVMWDQVINVRVRGFDYLPIDLNNGAIVFQGYVPTTGQFRVEISG